MSGNDGVDELVVTHSALRLVDFFDLATGTRVARLEDLIAEPHEMAYNRAAGEVYVASTYRTGAYGQPPENERSHEITVLDVGSRTVVDVIDTAPFVGPHDLEYDASRGLLYASLEPNGQGDNGVLVVDAAARKVLGNIPTPGRNSHWMTIAPDGTRAFVAHKEAGFVSVVDLESRTVADTIDLPGGGEEIDVSPDGSAVYIATPVIDRALDEDIARRSALAKIDVASGAVVTSLPLTPSNHALRVTADNRVLVAQMIDFHGGPHGYLHVVDGDSMKLLGSVALQGLPFTVRATPDSSTAYVANFGSGTVSVVDLERIAVVDVWDSTAGAAPGLHGMCLVQRP